MVLTAVGIVSTPLIWLRDSPGAGALAGASIQAAAGIAALVRALFLHPSPAGPKDEATRTGKATPGGTPGIKQPSGRGKGSATVERTGEVSGEGSVSASTTRTRIRTPMAKAPRKTWDEEPEPSVTVTDTGKATATNGAVSNTGYLSVGTLAIQQRAPRNRPPGRTRSD